MTREEAREQWDRGLEELMAKQKNPNQKKKSLDQALKENTEAAQKAIDERTARSTQEKLDRLAHQEKGEAAGNPGGFTFGKQGDDANSISLLTCSL